jgi:hypothetical protein
MEEKGYTQKIFGGDEWRVGSSWKFQEYVGNNMKIHLREMGL